jgi:transcriptional regulator with GAF, ATPase, and Fis domain
MSNVKPDDDPIETRASSAGALPGSAVRSVGIVVTVLSGQSKGVTRPLSGTLRIGKANDNDLVLGDDTVSRHHCELVRTGDGIHVKDLGSTNGTKVEGARVQEATFPAGTVLRVGEVEIALRPQPQRIEVLPSERTRFGPAIGHSVTMRTIFALLERIAPTDATVLFQGETGTGKDVLARAVVDASPRATKPFVVVDCGAVSYALLESELFGHERGAFTGAVATRQGAFELAEGGTVFLDEIGELPLDVQPKLLRVLETREFRRVGGNRTFRCDVRVIAATKRDLPREVAGGKFREDLYYRLAVVPVFVPPLRARRDDIEPLVEHILRATGSQDIALAKETAEALAAHDWPGNVRELRNVLERALYMTRATGAKELNALAFPLSAGGAPGTGAGGAVSPSAAPGAESAYDFDPQRSYRDTRAKYDADFEKRYVKWLLGRHNGNVSAAAREAKMDRKHLHDMAKKHALRGNEE